MVSLMDKMDKYNRLWSEGMYKDMSESDLLDWAVEAIDTALYFGGPHLFGVDQRNRLLDMVIERGPESSHVVGLALYYRGMDDLAERVWEGLDSSEIWISRIRQRAYWDPFWGQVLWPNFKRVSSGPLSYEEVGILCDLLRDPFQRQTVRVSSGGPVALGEVSKVVALYQSGGPWVVKPERLDVDKLYDRFMDFGTLMASIGC